jgi:hypothetical protein
MVSWNLLQWDKYRTDHVTLILGHRILLLFKLTINHNALTHTIYTEAAGSNSSPRNNEAIE